MLLLCIADTYSILHVSSTLSWTLFIIEAILCFHFKLRSLLAAASMWYIKLCSALVLPVSGLSRTFSGISRKSTLLRSADMFSQ
ncbi:hypothetical protein XELAEV_18043553mg [Xenopus laevis]|uniref:Uncharacterized protein n=1 Tax=Xenopus laevis TaxID=8355 RepID=A0A974BX72_XENLA|nr:hypothetical protein XELAEV_18043553mg [Xenopus laevis]